MPVAAMTTAEPHAAAQNAAGPVFRSVSQRVSRPTAAMPTTKQSFEAPIARDWVWSVVPTAPSADP